MKLKDAQGRILSPAQIAERRRQWRLKKDKDARPHDKVKQIDHTNELIKAEK